MGSRLITKFGIQYDTMNFGSKKTWPLNRVPMVFLQSLLFSDGLVTDLLQQQNVKSFLSWSQNAPISTIIYEWIHVSILVMSILHIHKTYVVTQIYIELYDYLEPKWPRFLKGPNPPNFKAGIPIKKQGVPRSVIAVQLVWLPPWRRMRTISRNDFRRFVGGGYGNLPGKTYP